ncbi:hypothetical protein [Salinispira pacifica]|uniref:Uncharacterized protein n=1 Tax=Salinispira pacifica TaxID=1307761 RepID=V5WGI8_9SPIO|nr:hypothetical protein [Salinispira pacifica]AHC14947.1 hypothetical protein L21SP2_1558 [Salinispira pacifica]
MLNSLRQTYGGLERSVYFLFLLYVLERHRNQKKSDPAESRI